MQDSVAGVMECSEPKGQQAVNTINTGEPVSAHERSESRDAESETPDSGTKENENIAGLDGIKHRARIADYSAMRLALNKLKADTHYFAADDATKRVMEEQSRDEVMAYRKRKGIDYQTKVDKALGKIPNSIRVTQRAIDEAMLNYAAPIPESTAADVDAWYQQLAASSGYGCSPNVPKVAQPPKPEKRSRVNELQAFRAYEANMETNFLTDSEASDIVEVEP